jgi:Zn-dependent protease with chaperone function/uncharacterized tellurite resistance protein B-like protein
MNNFFEHQARARRNTQYLAVLMVLAVIVISLAFYGVGLGLQTWALTRSARYSAIDDPGLSHAQILTLSFSITTLIVLVASSVRLLSLRGGGSQIAEMLGGRLISGSARDTLEKRAVNVVEEMAIASGVPVPQVFVLENEPGINAFAAGLTQHDAAVAVTRGCLEKLTREELQGVIAHEFSHIHNGDMRLNIRLMGVVFGIACIGHAGRILLELAGNQRSSRDDKRNLAQMLFWLGLAAAALGALGQLCGKFIQAAISRQREYLADASAVQFTRNPVGIAGALRKIGGYPLGATVSSARAAEASHFFFGDIRMRNFSDRLLATHPPLETRIKRIVPTFDGSFPNVGEGILEPEEPHSLAAPISGLAAAKSHGRVNPEHVAAQIGTVTAQALDRSHSLLEALPQRLREATQNPFSACAIVYAMLLSDDDTTLRAQRAQLEALAGAGLHLETLRTHGLVLDLAPMSRLPVVKLLAPALRQLSSDQRARFVRCVQALVDADQHVSTFEYVLGHMLRTRMERQPDAPSQRKQRSLRTAQAEVGLLLSMLAHAGARDPHAARHAFASAAARIPELSLTLLQPEPRLLLGLGAALATLAQCEARAAAQLIDACAHVVFLDRQVTEDEDTLLQAVCDTLDLPMPLHLA